MSCSCSALFDAGEFQELFDLCRRRLTRRGDVELAEDAIVAFVDGDHDACRKALYRLDKAWTELDEALRAKMKAGGEKA